MLGKTVLFSPRLSWPLAPAGLPFQLITENAAAGRRTKRERGLGLKTRGRTMLLLEFPTGGGAGQAEGLQENETPGCLGGKVPGLLLGRPHPGYTPSSTAWSHPSLGAFVP